MKNDELILYRYENDNKKISDKEKIEIKYRILKRQNRNALIYSISTFLYLSVITFFISTEKYFSNQEKEITWLIIGAIIYLIASVLLIFCIKTKSKEGKIKFKYKNEKAFYVYLIFLLIGTFITFNGLNLTNTLAFAIGFTFYSVSISAYTYHNRTKGNKKISIIKKILSSIIAFLIGFLFAFLLDKNSYNNEYSKYEYSKNAIVIYDEINRPNLIKKANKTWYMFNKKYNTNHYELSVSNKPEDINVVYEIDDVLISNLYGNDNYAAWTEFTKDSIIYAYYDKQENQPYELLTLPFSNEQPQLTNIGLYKDNIYYEIIDYDNDEINIYERNISTNTDTLIYKIETSKSELPYNTLNVEGKNLILTTSHYNKLKIIHFNLDDISSDPKIIDTNEYSQIAYTVSYNNDTYAVYYKTNNIDKIALFNKNGKLINNIHTFGSNNFAYLDKIELKNNKLYWINYKYSKKKDANNYYLSIYDLKSNDLKMINNIFYFEISNNKIYGLGFYNKNIKDVRLYEIYK